MSQPPLVSIVVPSRTGHIDALREQLRHQSFTDWELHVQAGVAPPARARNLAAQQARGRFVVFLDDDVTLGHSHLIRDVVDELSRLDWRDVIGVPICLAPTATRFQTHLHSLLLETPVRDDPQTPLVETSWHDALGGCCMATSRRLFESLRGFDESLIAGEDYDLLYRARGLGGRVYRLATGWVFHAPPVSFVDVVNKTIWYAKGDAQLAQKYPTSQYRVPLRSRSSAIGYLLLRTICLVPLMFMKLSYHHRRPIWTFQPLGAVLSYINAWVYCMSWYRVHAASAGAQREVPA